jgi:hypothetical protein
VPDLAGAMPCGAGPGLGDHDDRRNAHFQRENAPFDEAAGSPTAAKRVMKSCRACVARIQHNWRLAHIEKYACTACAPAHVIGILLELTAVMNNEPEFLVNLQAESLVAADAAHDAAPAVRPGASSTRTSGFRFERRSSYCAETAWVWQRARFVCAKQQ